MMLRAEVVRLLAIGFLAAAAAACSGGARQRPVKMGPVDEGPGSLTAARKFMEGRWSLESFEVYPPGKGPVTLKGTGTLSYDNFSNLKIEIRADQASSDLLRAAGIDIRDGLISSDGRTAVDMGNRTLTYIVPEQGAGTVPFALNRPRHWEVQGDLLTLTTKDDSGKPMSVGRWRKSP